MDYQKKYLKYKQKYLELKGGFNNIMPNLNTIPQEHIMSFLDMEDLISFLSINRQNLSKKRDVNTLFKIEKDEINIFGVRQLDTLAAFRDKKFIINQLNVFYFDCTDEQLEQLLNKIYDLQILILSVCYQITGSGFRGLSRLNSLHTIHLYDCAKITNFSHLRGLINLQTLKLNECNITDDELEHLTGLINLQNLDLILCPQITDRGLEYLSGLRNLQSLNLGMCNQITDAGLEYLSGLRNLQNLNLGMCNQITDRGLEYLSGLRNLQSLYLFDCPQITDRGLEHLSGLTSLEILQISGCYRITRAGITWLNNILPELEIYN
jgi:hypothetical protein